MKKSISEEDCYIPAMGILTGSKNKDAVMFETVSTSIRSVMAENKGVFTAPVPGRDGEMYVKWGADDQMPYKLIDMIESDEVLSENKNFNVKSCFGQGIRVYDRATNLPTTNKDVTNFVDNNSYDELFTAQIYDMMYFAWSLDVIILNRAGDRIVNIIHKAAENVRFQEADVNGVVHSAYYGNWRCDAAPLHDVEKIDLLDIRAPWEDLKKRMEMIPGKYGIKMPKSNLRMFGVLTMMPIPGSRYYPIPPYAALIKGGWLEIKKLIQINLKATLQNTQSIRYHVEIHQNFWKELYRKEGVIGNLEKQKALVKKKEEEIRDFLTKKDNKGKTWISEYMTDVTGKDIHMIHIDTIDTSKKGGDWSDDISEACNMLCYADEIHPNLVGAVPGKSQTNNSGSDKRELFTMKQAMMTLPQRLLMKVHQTALRYNGWWENVGVNVPMITLTVLSTHEDAKTMVNDPNA